MKFAPLLRGSRDCVVWPTFNISALMVLLMASVASSLGAAQSWQQGAGYRFRTLPPRPDGHPGFTLLTPAETGVAFTNSLSDSRALTNTVLPSGSGVAAGDVDGDGRCDLFFSGLGGGSRLFRNLGNWKFEDITSSSGVDSAKLDSTGVLLVDFDGDGDLDLVMNSVGGGTHIFLNDGTGHFTPVKESLNQGKGGMSLAMADADGDGYLDLYVANYRASTILDAPGTRFTMTMKNQKPEVATINGRPLTDPEWTNRFRFKIETDGAGRGRLAREELGEADVLYLNDGKGWYSPVSWTGGAFVDEDGKPLETPPFDWGFSVMFRDFNGDGSPDIYVCNDFNSPDRFWINDGRGHFRAAARPALRQTSFSSMGIDVADLNRDGNVDFMVVDMFSPDHKRRLTQRNMTHSSAAALSGDNRPQFPRNTLFLSRGDGTFAEIAQYAGLEATDWSWTPLFIDVDLDGFEDLLVSNGFARDNMNIDVQNRIRQLNAGRKVLSVDDLATRRLFPKLVTPNLAYRNRGDLTFEESSAAWGFNTAAISQGACLADLDNDGDLDVIVNNMNEPAGLYRNNGSAARVDVRLKGLRPNTQGIGARITVRGGPVPMQSQEVVCGGRYMSCDEALRVFAAGSPTNRLQIEVVWRSGKRSLVSEAQPDCLYEVDEAKAVAPVVRTETLPTPAFEDVSERLLHQHHEDPFDDFIRQPLLPRRLSDLGPGVCWWDMDGDGWDELLIGSGEGGELACFRNNQRGGFERQKAAPWTAPVPRDQTAVLGWNAGAVLVASANYEDGQTNGSALSLFKFGEQQPTELARAWAASVGPAAVADYDADGQLDVFLGARVKAGNYPQAVESRLFRQKAGELVLDNVNTATVAVAGLVSGAVWSDLDGDGFPELILASEWGPLRVFKNNQGRLSPRNVPVSSPSSPFPGLRESTLDHFTGWWNGVTTGDLDGDGRPDIIAANWGRNTKYQRYREKALRVYYGHFGEEETTQLIEACFERALGKYVPIRLLDSVSRGLPSLLGRYPNNADWAEAGIEEALEAIPERKDLWEAVWLESTVFLNRGGRFEAQPLPWEAQLAPGFAVCVADYDGDGREDVFISQNYFGVDMETSRYDAGRGLWLRGDGDGRLTPVAGQISGVKVYGEQRGAAVCDFDGDGRVDLAVAQNGDSTRLFRNVGGKPGLRVRLKGPGANPYAVGAGLRLRFGDRWGPLREIHSGSGYWSQDSVVQVLGCPDTPAALQVLWSGGRKTVSPVPLDAAEVLIDSEGELKVLKNRTDVGR